jgi:hypothetical protein
MRSERAAVAEAAEGRVLAGAEGEAGESEGDEGDVLHGLFLARASAARAYSRSALAGSWSASR